MEDVLDKPIIVLDYKISPSSKREGTECLTLSIEFEGKKRIIFTGGKQLIEAIKLISKENFPFTAVIKKEYKSFIFT